MRTVTLSSGMVLRPYRLEDAPALFAAVDTDRERLLRWMPWVPHSTTVETFVEFITAARRQEDDGVAFHRGLFDGTTVAGSCGATVDLVNRAAEIGYWLGGAYEGRGVITEAVGLMLGFLFDDYAVHRVVIRAAVENVRSRAVAQRYRFTEEGILREALILDEVPTDAVISSLLEDEWRSRPRGQ
ncbi:MAG: GNAT family N-acetyltransferase [Acidimicrobiia bacterium]|nr:GNAT family N-acetyltransferase [Acidimicrobiia bacterium]